MAYNAIILQLKLLAELNLITMRFKSTILLSFFLSLIVGCSPLTKVDLAGEWQVYLDRADAVNTQELSKIDFNNTIVLPGTTDQAKLGIKGDTTLSLTTEKLTHLTRKYSYIGAAWYERKFNIPASWEGADVILTLERVLWRSDVWINGKKVDGFAESLIAPHRYDVSKYLKSGENSILIKIDNRKQHSNSVRNLAHAYTDHTQTIWNGIIGEISLTRESSSKLGRIIVEPDLKAYKANIQISIESNYDGDCEINYNVVLRSTGERQIAERFKQTLKKGENNINIVADFGKKMKIWNEFSPELYDMTITAKYEDGQFSTHTESFGMREIISRGNKLFLNGIPLFLRGTLECNIFPLTGHPPMNAEEWAKLFTAAREWGLNHLRFHSWCPPKAAFEAADEMGFYLQVELPFWTLDIGADELTMEFMRREGDAILAEYGNHPSFVFMCLGNELQGDFSRLADLMKYYKSKDSRRLYTTTAFTFEKGHGVGPEPDDDFFITQWTKNGWVRGQGVFNQKSPTFNNNYVNAIKGVDCPLITHEIGQYSVYPQLSEIEKYTGVLDPVNLKSVKADLAKKGLLDRAEEYTYSSGRFASILYKEEIERALKTAGISGFQLLDLHDFPGQGTALVGLLNAFWESKGVISAERFREFNNAVTPLLSFPKATYLNSEKFEGSVAISNFSDSDLTNFTIEWSAETSGGEVVARGEERIENMPLGFNGDIAIVEFPLSKIPKAEKLEILLSIKGTEYRNRWSIWIYPSNLKVDFKDIRYTRDFKEAKRLLSEGRKVLYNPDWKKLKGIEGKFVPVFWSPVHFPKQAGTMGVLANPSHPALKKFPTDCHTDWQWWDLNINSTTMIVDSIKGGSPIVEMVDNFANNRRLALLYEGSVGDGKIIISSIDLSGNLQKRIVAKQMLHSLIEYMTSADFKPTEIKNLNVVGEFIKNSDNASKEDATSIY